MVYFDRFFIGAMISMASVAYFVTPYELITKFGLISGALVSVLFPAFSTTMVQDRDRTALLFGRGINYTLLMLFPLILIIVTIAHEGMTLWLGTQFADNSTFVLQWLAVGVFINSIARISSALIQGAGRPDVTAKIHLVELPFYILTLWWLLGAYGIKGAAIAWVVRVGIDTLMLFAMVQKLLPYTKALIRNALLKIIMGVCVFIVAGYTVGLFMKVLFLGGTLTIFIAVTWLWLLAPEERRLLKRFLLGFNQV